MLTLAGFPLPLPTREISDFISANIDPALYCPWLRRTWPGFGLAGITWPTGHRQERPFRMNRFYWPQSASRWAFGHFYCDATTADQIRDVAFGSDGTHQNKIPLVMTSPGTPNAEVLTTNVYLLPPYPFSAVPIDYQNHTINNAYLLTVVDQRYYWWYVQTPKLTYTDSTAWSTVFTDIATALNITINRDTINSAYLNAAPGLNLSYEVIPPFFDAVAYNVGQRVVVKLNGSVYTQNFSTAQTTLQNDLANNPLRVVRAGDLRFKDDIL